MTMRAPGISATPRGSVTRNSFVSLPSGSINSAMTSFWPDFRCPSAAVKQTSLALISEDCSVTPFAQYLDHGEKITCTCCWPLRTISAGAACCARPAFVPIARASATIANMFGTLIFVSTDLVGCIIESLILTLCFGETGARIAAHACYRFTLRDGDHPIAISTRLIVVMSAWAVDVAHGRIDAAALKVERSVDLVLEFDEHVVTRNRQARRPRKRSTDRSVLLQVAAALPVGSVINISRAVIHRGLRVGAQWTCQGRGRAGDEGRHRRVARSAHLTWSNTILYPVDDRIEVGALLRPRPEAAVAQNTQAA